MDSCVTCTVSHHCCRTRQSSVDVGIDMSGVSLSNSGTVTFSALWFGLMFHCWQIVTQLHRYSKCYLLLCFPKMKNTKKAFYSECLWYIPRLGRLICSVTCCTKEIQLSRSKMMSLWNKMLQSLISTVLTSNLLIPLFQSTTVAIILKVGK